MTDVTPWTAPAHGADNWDTPLNAKLGELVDGVNAKSSLFVQPTDPAADGSYVWVDTTDTNNAIIHFRTE